MEYTEQDIETMAKTIYGETRGEFYRFGVSSLIAVANVIANRKNKGFAKSIHEVCLSPYQFSCWNKTDPNYEKIANKINDSCVVFNKCLEVAKNVLSRKWPDLTDGCDHYHAKNIKPYWAVYLQPKRTFGSHCFYVLR
jgi:spore germination cell wall hydrolase CwlJ-like protein